VIKAVSSKYTPINQWLFFDSLECLPKEGLTQNDVKLVRSPNSKQTQKSHFSIQTINQLGIKQFSDDLQKKIVLCYVD
jgi:hypothetical protein